MSDLKNKIDGDVDSFFNDIEKQSYSDKKKTLKLLLEKYTHLASSDYNMDYYDFIKIIDLAKGKFSNDNAKKMLKMGSHNKKIDQNNLRNLFIIESTIQYLNRIDCLNKMPRFDYAKDQYEED